MSIWHFQKNENAVNISDSYAQLGACKVDFWKGVVGARAEDHGDGEALQFILANNGNLC